MSPSFFFRIDEIEEAESAIHHVDNRGNWIPSTDDGANRRIGGGVSGKYWYCNTLGIREVPQLPSGCFFYKTYSAYYSGGYGFLILRGDATNPPDDENWHPLRFEHDERDYSSYLTNAGSHSTLRTQRLNQTWPRLLLPDIYHNPEPTPYEGYGGLKGELPIFLSLVAFSTPRNWLENVLPTMWSDGAWRVHGYFQPRLSGRGVIVTVYTAPTEWDGGSGSLDLEQIENGNWGKYYT
ncbi:hypothetical protein EJ04DRAFT_247237 [Polyplosphaeria fusca]|uniref:Uncharacterized protein n=1 Tax=Polyplosphaeria fusca TaxID=682080 RepID=A0A9P4QXK6_9PLEO|nr:hypothetical protein EJ04DRAFT_247237 [Polyplosphaeria fusca]